MNSRLARTTYARTAGRRCARVAESARRPSRAPMKLLERPGRYVEPVSAVAEQRRHRRLERRSVRQPILQREHHEHLSERQFRQERRSTLQVSAQRLRPLRYSLHRFGPDPSDRSLARRPPSGFEWPSPRRPTNRGIPVGVCSTRSCTITSRPSACTPRVCATEKACPASSSRRSGTFCSVAGLPAGSRGFAAATAASTGSCLFRARAARCVQVAAAAGWPSGPRIWSITCSPTCSCGIAGVPSAAAALGSSGC